MPWRSGSPHAVFAAAPDVWACPTTGVKLRETTAVKTDTPIKTSTCCLISSPLIDATHAATVPGGVARHPASHAWHVSRRRPQPQEKSTRPRGQRPPGSAPTVHRLPSEGTVRRRALMHHTNTRHFLASGVARELLQLTVK